jgi:hypothetical protein
MAKSPFRHYLKDINKSSGYRATWEPGKLLKIGQIGKIDPKGFFVVYSSLIDEGFSPKVQSDDKSDTLDYSSKGTFEITAKVAGEVSSSTNLQKSDAGFDIKLNSEKSILFQIAGYTTEHIVNIGDMKKMILEKYRQGNWEKDLVVITELVVAKSSTIIISTTKGTQLTLKANADVGNKKLAITDASLNLGLVKETGSSMKFVATSGLTPLFRVMGLKKPIFGPPDVKHIKGPEDDFMVIDFKEEELEPVK